MKSFSSIILFLIISTTTFSQGAISNALKSDQMVEHADGTRNLGCGSFHFMQNQEHHHPGFMHESNQLMESIKRVVSSANRSTDNDVITVPVVFHILHSDSSNNVPDSVVLNQMKILRDAFRRENADTGNTRSEFKSIVGDSKIELELADFDPNGQPTNGIVRTKTNIKYFGGVLPYAQNQTLQIQKWLADSLYLNFFRITQTNQGGSDQWDPKIYLNIWVGDLRIFEPKLNNFEELFLLGLATNPKGHENWPDSVLPDDVTSSGILLHYMTVGSNNPHDYPSPYQGYNTNISQGKIAVHEVGHYYGLRHIWGDTANCTADDYIDDTPLCFNRSNFNCTPQKNTCADSSQGPDLPDMIENYMDYSSGDCQNAFTLGQIAVMREVYRKYRSYDFTSLQEVRMSDFKLFPNPTEGEVTLLLNDQMGAVKVSITDIQGKSIRNFELTEQRIVLDLNLDAGMYFVSINSANGKLTKRLVIQ